MTGVCCRLAGPQQWVIDIMLVNVQGLNGRHGLDEGVCIIAADKD